MYEKYRNLFGNCVKKKNIVRVFFSWNDFFSPKIIVLICLWRDATNFLIDPLHICCARHKRCGSTTDKITGRSVMYVFPHINQIKLSDIQRVHLMNFRWRYKKWKLKIIKGLKVPVNRKKKTQKSIETEVLAQTTEWYRYHYTSYDRHCRWVEQQVAVLW